MHTVILIVTYLFSSVAPSSSAQTCHYTPLDHSYNCCEFLGIFTCNAGGLDMHMFIVLKLLMSTHDYLVDLQRLTPFPLPLSYLMQPPGVFTNGLLDMDQPAKVNPVFTADGRVAHPPALTHLAHTLNPVISR